MSFEAYLANIEAKTGTTIAKIIKRATSAKLTKHGEIVAWLKKEYDLGAGHASAIAALVLKRDPRNRDVDATLDRLFAGKRGAWRAPADTLIARLKKFGPDVSTQAREKYINLMRGGKKFGILQPSSADRFDVGLKLKGVAHSVRFAKAGSWNPMMTHRAQMAHAKELNAELLKWLRKAYDAAGSASISP
jgi:hypothetical protein